MYIKYKGMTTMCAYHLITDFNMNVSMYKANRLGRALWTVLNVELIHLGLESYLEPLKDVQLGMG